MGSCRCILKLPINSKDIYVQLHISIHPSFSLDTKLHRDCLEKNQKYKVKKQQHLYYSLFCWRKVGVLHHDLNASREQPLKGSCLQRAGWSSQGAPFATSLSKRGRRAFKCIATGTQSLGSYIFFWGGRKKTMPKPSSFQKCNRWQVTFMGEIVATWNDAHEMMQPFLWRVTPSTQGSLQAGSGL